MQTFEDNKNNAIKLAKTLLTDFVKFQSVFKCIVGLLQRKENLKVLKPYIKSGYKKMYL